MVLINYESLYQSSIIVSRNSYIINDLIPILIKDTSKNNIFNILFIAHQDQDDSSIFINTTIRVDETERRSIIQNNLYCWKMKMEQYSSIISNIDFSRMYCTDLNMVQSIDHPLYYKNIAIKQIDDKHISVLDLHFTRDIFIKSNIYLKSFININNIENIFTDKKYKNMEYINIEQIKLDGTMKDDE